ncbi:MAG: OmpA family protein [Treponema sp.]|nr:OmpA family protein [Treponema sp.]
MGDYAAFANCSLGADAGVEYTLPLNFPKNLDAGLSARFDFGYIFPKKDTTLAKDSELRVILGGWLRIPFMLGSLPVAFQPELSFGLSEFNTQGQNGSTAKGPYLGTVIGIAPSVRIMPAVMPNFEIEASPLFTITPEQGHTVTMFGLRVGVVYHIQDLIIQIAKEKQRKQEEALAEQQRLEKEKQEEEAQRLAEEEAYRQKIASWPAPAAKLTVIGGTNFTPDGDGQNNTVSFEFGIDYVEETPESWTLAILDPQGNPFWSTSGRGNLPETLTWNGLSEKGEVVFSRNIYTAKLTVVPSRHDRTRSGAKTAEITQTINTGLLLQVIIPEHEWKIVVNTIYFAGGGATFDGLSEEQLTANRETLDEIAQQINEHPGVDVIVEGYANNVSGTEKEDKEELIPLSQERADFIIKELIARGIEPNKLSAVGKGGANPIAARKDRANWWKNRRIEFIIKK